MSIVKAVTENFDTTCDLDFVRCTITNIQSTNGGLIIAQEFIRCIQQMHLKVEPVPKCAYFAAWVESQFDSAKNKHAIPRSTMVKQAKVLNGTNALEVLNINVVQSKRAYAYCQLLSASTAILGHGFLERKVPIIVGSGCSNLIVLLCCRHRPHHEWILVSGNIHGPATSCVV